MHIQTCVSVQFVFCCEEEIDLATVAYLVLIRQLRNLCDIDRLMAYLYGSQQHKQIHKHKSKVEVVPNK